MQGRWRQKEGSAGRLFEGGGGEFGDRINGMSDASDSTGWKERAGPSKVSRDSEGNETATTRRARRGGRNRPARRMWTCGPICRARCAWRWALLQWATLWLWATGCGPALSADRWPIACSESPLHPAVVSELSSNTFKHPRNTSKRFLIRAHGDGAPWLQRPFDPHPSRATSGRATLPQTPINTFEHPRNMSKRFLIRLYSDRVPWPQLTLKHPPECRS